MESGVKWSLSWRCLPIPSLSNLSHHGDSALYAAFARQQNGKLAPSSLSKAKQEAEILQQQTGSRQVAACLSTQTPLNSMLEVAIYLFHRKNIKGIVVGNEPGAW